MRVIITTDLVDEAASKILPLLSMFSKSDGLELVLFHCIEPPASGTVTIITINDILWQNAQSRIAEVVAEINAKTNNQYHIESEVRLGTLVQEMKKYLSENDSDLLILETAKRRGIRKLFDPQRSLEFIGEIPISTLIVPTDYRYVDFKKIGIALDHQEDVSVLTSSNFDVIKTYFGAEVKPFHIENLKQEHSEFIMKGTFGNERVSIAQSENIEAGITAWCHEENISVLCMLSHHKNIFSKLFSHSVTRQIIKSGELPVLILTAN